MYRFGLSLVCVLGLCMDCFGQASCSGVRNTPVRDLLATRPVRTATLGILQKISAVRTNSCGQAASLGCTGLRATSCAGSVQSSCAGSRGCAGNTVVPRTPAPEVKHVHSSPPGIHAPMDCPSGACNLAESHKSFATPIRTAMSSSFQQALASAQYRAANRIHGHSYLDTHRTSGVGWATSDSTPTTCLGRGGANYAVARGADGWYATKFTQ